MTNQPRYCFECKWGIENYAHDMVCMHPKIESYNSYSLSATSARYTGSSARYERGKTFIQFPQCGRSGKLWEPKELNIVSPTGENSELPF